MKNIKKFFYCLFLFVICFQLFVFKINADSGWDSGYDSGGSSSWDSGGSSWDSGGSSSWDYDSGGSYSGSGSSDFTFIDLIFTNIIFIVIIIIVMYYGKKTNSNNNFTNSFTINEFDENIIKQSISNFNKEEFKDLAFSIYVEVQNSWMNIDYESLRQLLTDELFNKYKSDLEVLELKKQKNIMSDYKLNNFAITNFIETETDYVITCLMTIELHDYITDNDNNVIRGNKNIIIEHDYELTFIRGKNKEEGTCPNCHAKLDDKASKVCPYCNSVIVTRNHDWVLSNKISKNQRTK